MELFYRTKRWPLNSLSFFSIASPPQKKDRQGRKCERKKGTAARFRASGERPIDLFHLAFVSIQASKIRPRLCICLESQQTGKYWKNNTCARAHKHRTHVRRCVQRGVGKLARTNANMHVQQQRGTEGCSKGRQHAKYFGSLYLVRLCI